MKKTFLIFPILIVSLFACQNKPKTVIGKENTPIHDVKPKLMDISSYTGNALIFYAEEYHVDPHVYLILIAEKDSNVFKQQTFDIRKAVQGKCSIYTLIGYARMSRLQTCKEKQILDFEICNIDYKYYVKAWICYAKMIEAMQKRKTPLLTDSCEVRNLFQPDGKDKNSKRLDYKVLKLE